MKRLLLLFLSMGISFSAVAQISLKAEKTPLKEVLVMIEDKSDYDFFYSSDLPDMDKTVDINVTDASIRTVLDHVFKGFDISYEIGKDMQIVLSERKPEPQKKAQPSVVSGRILDKDGEPVIGAGVIIAGTTKGGISDIDGKYSIEIVTGEEQLVFSSLGYESQTIAVNGRKVINVTLQDESRILDEVVVVAYGTQKKVNLSGSVSAVNMEEVGEKRSLTNLSAGLQGVTPGLLASQSSGEPGADGASVTVRGLGTLNNSAPLVVIDGIVGSMGDVNPNDVASMSVLKDAASSAIYGSRAANGVILITTKSGRGGQTKVSYNGTVGVQNVSCPIDVVDDYVLYMNTINKAFVNSGNVAPFGQAIINEWAENSGKNPIYANTDWFKATFKTALMQNHNVQAQGGNKDINYLVSVGYMQNNGTVDKTKYDRYSFRANISADVTKWLKMTALVSGYHGVQTGIDVNTTMTQLSNSSPGTLPLTEDGRWGGEWAPGGNAQAGNIYSSLGSYDKTTHATKGNGKLSLDVIFADNLRWNNSVAVSGSYTHTKQMNYPNIKLWDLKNDAVLILSGTTSTQLGETYAEAYTTVVDSHILYDILPSVDNHNLSLTAGYNQEYSFYHDMYSQGLDVLSKDTDVMNSATTPSKLTGTSTDSAVMSFFGRVNYDYKGKYLFEANFRGDGSSRFAKGHRWGFFPSFSAAWRLSEEGFLSNVPWMDNFKIRASWGQLGNNAVGDYATQLMYERKSMVFGDNATTGAGITEVVNRDLRWETTTMTNIGIDLNLFKNRLSLTADVFDKLTDDILVRTKIPLVLGGMTAPYQNAGIVRNRGVELEIGWKNTHGDFSYDISANYSFVRNKVLKYQGNVPSYSGQKILLEGYGIWSWYVREVDCIATQDKIDEMLADGYVFSPSTPKPGDFIYKDQQQPGEKGYKNIDDNDRVIKGTAQPEHFFGLNLGLGWKGLDASVLFSGVAGVQQYLNGTWYTNVLKNGSVINRKFLDAWSYDNQDSKYPALTSDDGGRNTVANDFWLQDGSYLKLRNATIGYTFPKRWMEPAVSRLRVYVTGENLWTLTKFEGLDPETASAYNYPTMKRFMFGVSITF